MSDVKLLRKQLRNVVQEQLPALLKAELSEAISKELTAAQNGRLDKIEAFCQDQLGKMDKRAKAVQGFMMNQVINDITSRLYESQVTMDAVVRVLADSGMPIENLNEKIAAKKEVIKEEHKKSAEAELEKTKQEAASEQKEEQSNVS